MITRHPVYRDYGVTPDGHVYRVSPTLNHRTVPYRIGSIQSDGYVKIVLIHGAARIQTYAHVLVAETLLGPRPSPDHECAHGNGVRSDNRVSNLRWATKAENTADRWGHGTMCEGEKHKNVKLTEAAVLAIRSSRTPGAKLAREFGISEGHVNRVKRRGSWAHV